VLRRDDHWNIRFYNAGFFSSDRFHRIAKDSHVIQRENGRNDRISGSMMLVASNRPPRPTSNDTKINLHFMELLKCNSGGELKVVNPWIFSIKGYSRLMTLTNIFPWNPGCIYLDPFSVIG
jgi:hypothetical protein